MDTHWSHTRTVFTNIADVHQCRAKNRADLKGAANSRTFTHSGISIQFTGIGFLRVQSLEMSPLKLRSLSIERPVKPRGVR